MKPIAAATLACLLAACTDSPPTVQFFGDSITMMETAALKAAISGVEVQAQDGAGVAQLLGKAVVDGPWPAGVSAPVVVLAYGANDAIVRSATPIAKFKERYRRLIAASPARMVLETPLPTTTPDRATAAYAQAVRELGAELGVQVIDTHACFLRMPQWQRHLPDGVHPDDEAVRYLVDVCIAPALHAPSQ